MNRIIAYYRVSTQEQGQSGLGLDAQRARVHEWAEREGHEIAAEYTEVESGGKRDRPRFHQAAQKAKELGCPVVTAKLDRLARSVRFLTDLDEAGIDFLALDVPGMQDTASGRLMRNMMMTVAEWERNVISERTKAGLKEAKKRGKKLGAASPNYGKNRTLPIGHEARAMAAAKKKEETEHFRKNIRTMIQPLKDAGWSYQAMAQWLMDNRILTSNDSLKWNKSSVYKIFYGDRYT